MIKYAITQTALNDEITAIAPRWSANATKRTQKLVRLGCFKEKTSIWSQVKPVYMKLQLNKCVFCERQFESPQYGTIEFDLEHFRPKSSVLVWPDSQRHANLNYAAATGNVSQAGYFWLAYEPLNYAASCKVCNTTFKLNYFPIAGARGAVNAPLASLSDETPYLCYPIGTGAEDPETLVTFIATIAVPTQPRGPQRLRGQIIIDFFGLNDREQLHRDRARMIALFGPALLAQAQGIASHSDLQLIDKMTQPNLPHCSCLRAYKRLWTTDAGLAQRIFEQCREYMFSEVGTPPPQ
ncbi:hypothetical protein [Pseudomonas fluorescens]|uniref:hypothetical protein n=1 Tax=Pseudomonas fluorescens TaxID=294 RepID=UPI001241A418|nr:hypothetical protein [Pseudomonas fluorescens]VVN49231.1 hypothetical protein PS639_06275 [Pseudomonas fluorescens]